jgi:hypothetical protein
MSFSPQARSIPPAQRSSRNPLFGKVEGRLIKILSGRLNWRASFELAGLMSSRLISAWYRRNFFLLRRRRAIRARKARPRRGGSVVAMDREI